MNEYVLDAWGAVAWLFSEVPAADHMEAIFRRAASGQIRLTMNVVNLGEVYYSAARRRGAQFAAQAMDRLRNLFFADVDEELALRAAKLKAGGGISYADAFAAATAIERGAALVTGDPELRRLAERVPELRLHWIGAS